MLPRAPLLGAGANFMSVVVPLLSAQRGSRLETPDRDHVMIEPITIGEPDCELSAVRVSAAIWSAEYRRTTGQAIVTRRVVEARPDIWSVAAIYSNSGLRSLPSVLRAAAVLWMAILRGRVQRLYLVCSRSDGGFLRDVPALLPAVFGTRVIVHAHGSDIIDLLSTSRIAPLARFLYSRCVLIVPSAHLVSHLETIPLRGLHVCENFLLPVPPDKAPPREDGAPGLMALWNSNIMSSKGFFELAEGVRLAREMGCDVRLASIGTPMGDSERTASETAREVELLKRNDWFTYLGRTDPEEAVWRTAAADVIVLPSRYKSECQPLGLIQAMCLGRRIIAADTPALRATLRDYPAILLENPTPSAIAEALVDALAAKGAGDVGGEKSLREAAANARTRFSVKRFDTQMSDLLCG